MAGARETETRSIQTDVTSYGSEAGARETETRSVQTDLANLWLSGGSKECGGSLFSDLWEAQPRLGDPEWDSS